MSNTLKKERKQVRFYISDQAAEKLERLRRTTGQTDVWIVDTLLESALNCVGDEGKISLPLRFQVDEPEDARARAREAPLPKRKAA